MKKLLLLLALTTGLFSQLDAQRQNKKEEYSDEPLSKLQIRLSTGANNFTSLLGIGLNVRVKDHVLACGGIGLGGWGFKTALGVKYEMKPDNSGWAFQGGYSVSSGISELSYTSSSNNSNDKISLQLNKAHALNFSAAYNFAFKKGRHNFYLECGYSVPLSTDPWVIKNGVSLSDTDKRVFRLLQPGGIILGLGFNIGI